MSKNEQNNQKVKLTQDLIQPTRVQPVNWWWFVSGLAVALFLTWTSLSLAHDLIRVIAVLILGVSIANALAPVVQWITDHLGISRSITILLIYLVFVLLFGVIIYITFPVFFAQVKSLIDLLNIWAPQAINWLGQAGFDANTLLNSFSSVSSRLGGLLFALPATIFSSLLDFVLVIFISLYWLILMKGMRDYFLSFFPASNRPQVVSVLSEMGSAMGGYLRGSAIDGLIYGTVKFIGLSVIGVPYALTLGILAATLEFFPTIGAIISALAATLVALSVSPTLALITLAFTVVLQQLENHVLVPLVMGSQTSISPLLAVLSVVSGSAVLGILGAIVGIPVVSALEVLFRRVFAPAIRKANGVQEGEQLAQKGEEEEVQEETSY